MVESNFEVLTTLIAKGPLARRELAQEVGISAPSLTRIIKYWIDRGVVKELGSLHTARVDKPQLGSGRPVEPLQICSEQAYFLGINLRAHQANAVLLNMGGKIVHELNCEIIGESLTAVCQVIKQIVESFSRLSSWTEVKGMGISLGGAVDENGCVKRAPFFGWTKVDFGSALTQEIKEIPHCPPFLLVNDVIALTYYELIYGSGRTHDDFALLTFGAGVGHGIVHGRKVVTIPEQGIGYIGHLPVANGWGICHREHKGCTSATLTLRGLRALLPVDKPKYAQFAIDTEGISDANLVQLVKMYKDGDLQICKAVDRYIETAGQLLSTIAAVSMTNLVALAGESVQILKLNPQLLHNGVALFRNPTLPPLQIEFRTADFKLWASGAATVSLLNWFRQE